MGLELSKWNPFRFVRRKPEEPQSPSSRPAAALGAGIASWANGGTPVLPAPFRLIDNLLQDPFGGDAPMGRWFGDYSPTAFQPNVDIVDEGDALRVDMELPGMSRNDVEVVAESGYLLVRGEKTLESEQKEQGCYRLERAFGAFQRMIPLPDDVDPAGVEAQLDKGVLSVHIPKAKEQRPQSRRIEVK